jgi:hypothetical protein
LDRARRRFARLADELTGILGPLRRGRSGHGCGCWSRCRCGGRRLRGRLGRRLGSGRGLARALTFRPAVRPCGGGRLGRRRGRRRRLCRLRRCGGGRRRRLCRLGLCGGAWRYGLRWLRLFGRSRASGLMRRRMGSGRLHLGGLLRGGGRCLRLRRCA